MKKVLNLVLQIIAVYFLSFVGAMASGAGNGWELVVFALGSAVGAWGVGALVMGAKDINKFWAALIGGALGVGLILISPATGFGQILYPMAGALLGYYFIPFGKK